MNMTSFQSFRGFWRFCARQVLASKINFYCGAQQLWRTSIALQSCLCRIFFLTSLKKLRAKAFCCCSFQLQGSWRRKLLLSKTENIYYQNWVRAVYLPYSGRTCYYWDAQYCMSMYGDWILFAFKVRVSKNTFGATTALYRTAWAELVYSVFKLFTLRFQFAIASLSVTNRRQPKTV